MSITYPACESLTDTNTADTRPMQLPTEPAVKAFELDPIADPRWKVFTDVHPAATVFHRVEWLRALRDCYGYTPLALTLTPPGAPLRSGLLFCHIRSWLTGNRLVSLPFSDHCEPLVSSPDEFDPLLRSLTEKVDRYGLKYVEVRPLRSLPRSRESFEMSNAYYLHRLDLRGSEESLFRALHKDSIQRKIRRAEREPLRCEEGRSELLLEYFYRLLIRTRRRQGLPPQPRKWFGSLLTHLGEKAKIRVALTGNLPVASILTTSDKKTLVYKYGCSDSRFNNLGGTALLMWRAIQEAKATGLEEFDMGRSDIDNAGLVTFKERWGAKRIIVNYWRYPARTAGLKPESRIKYASRLVSAAPDWSLVMLGNLLYRHIG